MSVASPIAARYAHALYGLAAEKSILDAVHRDLVTLGAWLNQSTDFEALIQHPSIPPAQAEAVLRALLEGQAHEETLRFLTFLISKRRLNQLADICAAFDEWANDAQGLLTADLISAAPFTESQQEMLAQKLGHTFGKTIRLNPSVDPSLIGGFRVQVRDQILDYSVRTMLENFRKKLLNA